MDNRIETTDLARCDFQSARKLLFAFVPRAPQTHEQRRAAYLAELARLAALDADRTPLRVRTHGWEP